MKGLKIIFKTAVSISVSAMLAVSILPVEVYAQTEYHTDADYGDDVKESILVNADGNSVTVTGGDIDCIEKPAGASIGQSALVISAQEEHTAKVTTGNITAHEVEGYDLDGVTILNHPQTAEDNVGGTVDLTVNGDINAAGGIDIETLIQYFSSIIQ